MTNSKLSKSVNVMLWTLQCILAAVLLSGAIMKLMPIKHVAAEMPWLGQVPEYIVRGLTLVDLAGAVGIILPASLKKNKYIVVFSAAGIFLLMACAIVFHILRGEATSTGINIFTAALALAIAVARTYELRTAGKACPTIS